MSDSRQVPDAFEALYRAHYARLCGFVTSYVHSSEAASDIVQDLFLTLWEKQLAAGSRELTAAYLYGAARNRALKYLRHQRVALRFRERSAPRDATTGVTDHDVRQRELAEAVDSALTELPDRCREIFLLSRRAHMSYAEIATALGISVKTVEVQMWRALRKLRDRLAPYLASTVLALTAPLWWFTLHN
jgi:RNA polymerase sigma-70 factor (ECF subfamily)